MKTLHFFKKTKFVHYLIVFVLLLSFQIGLVQTTSAQEALPLKPNDRLRITAPLLNMKKQVVTYIQLRELRGDRIVFNADSTMDISLSSITRLGVSRGRKSKAGLGALIGGVVGGVVGENFNRSLCSGSITCTTGDHYGIILVGAGVVAGVGALIGLAFKSERWKKVPLNQLYIGVVSESESGIGLGIVIKF